MMTNNNFDHPDVYLEIMFLYADNTSPKSGMRNVILYPDKHFDYSIYFKIPIIFGCFLGLKHMHI